jgi:hypothetical protein
MQRLKSVLTALAVAIVLVASLDFVAAAATGSPMILGQLNTANRTTTVQNTGSGPAARFISSSGAPIAVNRTTKVARLNADLLDGKSATDLYTRTKTFRYSVTALNGDLLHRLPQQSAGHYLVTWSLFLDGITGVPADPNVVECFMQQFSATDVLKAYNADSMTTVTGSFKPSLSAAGVMSLATGDKLDFKCDVKYPQVWSTVAEEPIQISLTRIDSLTAAPVVNLSTP